MTITHLRAVFEGDTSGLDRAIEGVNRKLDNIGKNRTLAIGGALTAGVTVPLVGIAAAALRAGLALDDAFDKIRVGTGATGAALTGLQESFKNVARDTPSSLGDVSTAMVALSQRTGLTGAALEALTKQQLDLARITGGDVASSIRETTRLLGDWGIKTRDAAGASDFLFRVGQQTGVSLSSLRSLLVQYGAPLRQLGFGFQQSAVMIAKFQKEGVNTELVLAALRKGLQAFAKAGVDPATTLQALINKIRDTKNAAEANSLGFKVFGARLGSDMVAAIREGRFNLDELIKKLAQSKDSISGAARETEDFGETWQRFQNRMTIGAAALGTPLVNILNNLVTALEPAIRQLETFSRWFVELPQGTQNFALGLAGVAAAAGPVITGIAGIKVALTTLSPAMGGVLKQVFNWRNAFLIAGAAMVYFTTIAVQKMGGLDATFNRVTSGFMSGIKMIADFSQAAGKLSLPELGKAASDLWKNWGANLKAGWGVLTGQFKTGAAAVSATAGASAKSAAQSMINGFNMELPKVVEASDANLNKLLESTKKKGKDRLKQQKEDAARELKQWNSHLLELKNKRIEATTDDPRPLLRQQLRERFPRRSAAEIEGAVTRELGIRRIEAAEQAQEAARRKRDQALKQATRDKEQEAERARKAAMKRSRDDAEQALKDAQNAVKQRLETEEFLHDFQRKAQEERQKKLAEGLAAFSDRMKADAERLQEQWRPLTEGLANVFGSAFRNIEGGFGGVVKSIKKGFSQMLVDMAAEFLASQLSNLLFKLLGQVTGVQTNPLGSVLGNLSFGGAGAGAGGGGGGATVMPYERYQGGVNMLGALSGSSGPAPAAVQGAGFTVQVNVRGEQTPAMRQNATATGATIARTLERSARRNG